MIKTVCSFYFMPLSMERPLYGGVYRIPAVLRGGKPEFLTISDAIQPEKQPHIIGGHRIPITIHAEDIAADFVKTNAANGMGMNGDCGPALWVVRDSMPLLDDHGIPLLDAEKRSQFRPATEEEKAAMWAEDMAHQTMRQDHWCDWLISMGDMYDADPEKKQRVWITPTMRIGAKHAGRTGGWVDETAARVADNRSCVFCTKTIPSGSVVCQFCSNVVDRARYDALTAKQPIPPPLKLTGKDQPAA